MNRKCKPNKNEILRKIPSVDDLSRSKIGRNLVERFGHQLFVSTAREFLEEFKKQMVQGGIGSEIEKILPEIDRIMKSRMTPKMRNVLNLTGTVLHTNLGRSVLSKEAVDQVALSISGPVNLEYDVNTGKRGDRDKLVEESLCRLTGAEAATVINNNAAAVFLALSSLGYRKEVLVSRGELVEIGGEFRIPDIMKRAGAKLIEVGTTNRTHLRDFELALSGKTGAIMKVHTSNYVISGFTAVVPERDLAAVAKAKEVPFIIDLGSGTLVDLSRYGLPKEQTVKEAIELGGDLVTFSCDKLLGGPQCGVIAGRKDLIAKVKRNPLKRVLRVDKMTIAALEATLRLYSDPENLNKTLPALRTLTRAQADIRETAGQILPELEKALEKVADVELVECMSQIGSGALPVDRLPSWGIKITPCKREERQLKKLSAIFRKVPVPMLGRISDGSIIFDFRCLEKPDLMLKQIKQMELRSK
ncbi:MAG: L-seryl-tRNA(Sec) selenium transferase [Pseudomonadota bacterium]|nr:L-seryl-tRNA(Sec) selenium transferase [Pseudomonadota bacterium]